MLPALDGLRGLAVLIVLASHLANAGLPVLPGLSLSGTGKSGVYLFFVLSAYLLTRLLLARPAREWRSFHLWIDYGLRRVLRIWPLYLVVLFVSALMTATGVSWWPYPMDMVALLRHLLLLEGVSVLWSIPVEFHYYLWLPLVAAGFAFACRGKWGSIRGMAWFALLATGALLLWPPEAARVNDVRPGPYLVLFFAGAAAAALGPRLPLPSRAWAMIGSGAVLALVATVPAVWAVMGFGGFQPDLNHRWFGFFALAWGALLLALVHGPDALRRPFESAPMRWVGRVSFSAYLWHMPILAAVVGPLGLSGVPALLAVLAATGLASQLSWYMFERPLAGVRWRKGAG